MTPAVKLMGLLALAAVLLVLPALGADELGQVSLSIYVDDDFGKALVVGYIDDPESLPFLDAAGQIYEEDTGMVYAVTDSLVGAEGSDWCLKFPLEGDYNEYHAVFYIPGNVDLKKVDCSKGLDFLSSSYNGSLVLDVHGFDLTDPEVSISYQAA